MMLAYSLKKSQILQDGEHSAEKKQKPKKPHLTVVESDRFLMINRIYVICQYVNPSHSIVNFQINLTLEHVKQDVMGTSLASLQELCRVTDWS